MVCGDERPDLLIAVAYRPVNGYGGDTTQPNFGRHLANDFPATRWNVRYCLDRSSCVAEATAPGPWSPPKPGA